MRGWENLGRGSVIDIENNKKKIIAEVKNKHNTTKGNHKVAIYDDLASQLRTRPGYTAYYVEVIPKNKKTYDKPFTPSDNRKHSRKAKNEAIRVIDGKSFYALASGDKDALKKVYEALPEVIAKVLKKSSRKLTKKDLDALFGRVY